MFSVFNRALFWEAGILPLNYSRFLVILLLNSIELLTDNIAA
jgi:hypothetical protein